MRRKFRMDREPDAFRLAGEKSRGQGRDDVLLSAQGTTAGTRDGGCTGIRGNNFADLGFLRRGEIAEKKLRNSKKKNVENFSKFF